MKTITLSIAFIMCCLTGTWLVSCNQKQSPSQVNAGTTNHLLNDSSVRFSWQVTGCAEKGVAGKSRSGTAFSEFPEQQVELSPELRVPTQSEPSLSLARIAGCRGLNQLYKGCFSSLLQTGNRKYKKRKANPDDNRILVQARLQVQVQFHRKRRHRSTSKRGIPALCYRNRHRPRE